mmetsp:Transcript_30818/g.61114  ORF Transcript_30818/g.61114 Transcript_30818/m.61114 type:complete len:213 (+) Transcript_30818:285-923(+)
MTRLSTSPFHIITSCFPVSLKTSLSSKYMVLSALLPSPSRPRTHSCTCLLDQASGPLNFFLSSSALLARTMNSAYPSVFTVPRSCSAPPGAQCARKEVLCDEGIESLSTESPFNLGSRAGRRSRVRAERRYGTCTCCLEFLDAALAKLSRMHSLRSPRDELISFISLILSSACAPSSAKSQCPKRSSFDSLPARSTKVICPPPPFSRKIVKQ